MISEMKDLVYNNEVKSKKANITVLSAEEVAEATGYTAQTILNWKEEIGYHTKGRHIRFFPDDVENWLKLYKKKSILNPRKLRP
ncbi:Helix-turn-helix domain protein [compost metagenome]